MTPCVLGCDPDNPRPIHPGHYTCDHHADRLADLLADIADRLTLLTDPAELLPSGSNERGQPGYSSRSPARDDLIAHTDIRTTWTDDTGPGALAVLHSWARLLRDEHGAATPNGPATVATEYGTLRWHWLAIIRSPWIDELARELIDVQLALRHANRETGRTIRLGPCPTTLRTGLTCAAILRATIGHDTITCRTCDTTWPRHRWVADLGDPWVDYAALSELLDVAVGTLWRWCNEDQWRTSGTRARRLVHRADALDSHARRRAPTETPADTPPVLFAS